MPSAAAVEDVEIYDSGIVMASLLLHNSHILYLNRGLSPPRVKLMWHKKWCGSKSDTYERMLIEVEKRSLRQRRN